MGVPRRMEMRWAATARGVAATERASHTGGLCPLEMRWAATARGVAATERASHTGGLCPLEMRWAATARGGSPRGPSAPLRVPTSDCRPLTSGLPLLVRVQVVQLMPIRVIPYEQQGLL